MDKADYAVKNVKEFMGMDCPGFNATLYRGGKRVATVVNDGSGGETLVDWLDRGGSMSEIKVRVKYGERKGETFTRKVTAEEATLVAHVKTLPLVKSEYFPEGLEVGEDGFIEELVSDFLAAKQIKKWCKTQTLFVTADMKLDEDGEPFEFRTIKHAYCPEVSEYLRGRFGDDLVEIVNERL